MTPSLFAAPAVEKRIGETGHRRYLCILTVDPITRHQKSSDARAVTHSCGRCAATDTAHVRLEA